MRCPRTVRRCRARVPTHAYRAASLPPVEERGDRGRSVLQREGVQTEEHALHSRKSYMMLPAKVGSLPHRSAEHQEAMENDSTGMAPAERRRAFRAALERRDRQSSGTVERRDAAAYATLHELALPADLRRYQRRGQNGRLDIKALCAAMEGAGLGS